MCLSPGNPILKAFKQCSVVPVMGLFSTILTLRLRAAGPVLSVVFYESFGF